jgi:uncharacterized protein (DUF1330 family)
MAGYILVNVEVLDPVGYQQYTAQVPDTVARFGGKFLIRAGANETLEGEWEPHRIVLLEFPSVEQARAWYDSPEYQAIIPLRQRYSRTHFFSAIEGWAPPSD